VFLLSARPATLLHALPIRTPRSARNEADVVEIRNEIARLNQAEK
jgi:hypothetical protein